MITKLVIRGEWSEEAVTENAAPRHFLTCPSFCSGKDGWQRQFWLPPCLVSSRCLHPAAGCDLTGVPVESRQARGASCAYWKELVRRVETPSAESTGGVQFRPSIDWPAVDPKWPGLDKWEVTELSSSRAKSCNDGCEYLRVFSLDHLPGRLPFSMTVNPRQKRKGANALA